MGVANAEKLKCFHPGTPGRGGEKVQKLTNSQSLQYVQRSAWCWLSCIKLQIRGRIFDPAPVTSAKAFLFSSSSLGVGYVNLWGELAGILCSSYSTIQPSTRNKGLGSEWGWDSLKTTGGKYGVRPWTQPLPWKWKGWLPLPLRGGSHMADNIIGK